MSKPRQSPFIWVTWLTKLLAGEDQCEWATWFKANHLFDKQPSDGCFNQSKWQMDHAALIAATKDDLIANEYIVTIENQNGFSLKGQKATLGGKPDLIAVREDENLIIDTKACEPRLSHEIQVMIYMWAVPLAISRYRGMQFDGMVIYETATRRIKASKIDDKFIERVTSLIKRASADQPPPKTPSLGECRFCPIGKADCHDRLEPSDEENGYRTDLF
jgi:CRISPR/Cas system-associated exonuclease Cas4 (RecB family)